MNGPVGGCGASARRLVLWRHGRTVYNTETRFQGHLDPPLDVVGRRQALIAARALSGLRPTMLVSSDLSRAAQTAAELAQVTALPALHDQRLREYDVGPWEGLTRRDVAERFPAEYEAWVGGVHPATWESADDLAERASRGVEQALAGLADGGVLVVVSHGGALRALLGRLLGLGRSSWPRLAELGNCHWSVLGERSGRWTLLEHNVHAPEASDVPAGGFPISTSQDAEVR